jgi:hypothetical protein
VIKDSLAFGVLWLHWVRSHSTRFGVGGLRLIVPKGTSGPLLERALGLVPASRTEIFELFDPERRLEKMDPAEAGNVDSWLITRGEMESLLNQARAAISRVHALAPHLPPAATKSQRASHSRTRKWLSRSAGWSLHGGRAKGSSLGRMESGQSQLSTITWSSTAW